MGDNREQKIDWPILLRECVKSEAIQPQLGSAMLLIWRDYEHALEWTQHQVMSSPDVRIISLPSEHLPELVLPERSQRSQIAFVGAALGKEADLSDTHLMCYLTLSL
jgi:hypothetical protein